VCGVSPHHKLGIFNGDISTLEAALLERMYYCNVDGQFVAAPKCARSTIEDRLRNFGDKVVLDNRNVTPMSITEVVDTYRGRKRAIYEQAEKSLNLNGLKRSHAHSICFVKVEKGNPAKAPRCIQPRRAEYNLCVGKYIKRLEHRLYRSIARIFGDGPTVMKGYNVVDVARIVKGKWDSFVHPVAIGLDAVKFDMHVSPEMLGWEHGVYNRIFKSAELRKLLGWQMNNIGRGYCVDGKLKYKVKGKRFSGDMNTALGNCLIMCAMVWAYAKERGVSCKLVNNGDDCVVFMEQQDLSVFKRGLEAWFLDMGFRMTVEEPVYEMEQIEFCQMHPVYAGGEWKMCRNIHTALIKDSLSVVPLTSRTTFQKWLGAVGECGLALCSGVPVMQAFYQCYMRNSRGLQGKMSESVQMQSGMRLMAKGLESKARSVSDAARYSYWLAFGVTPDQQVAVEQYYERLMLEYTPQDNCNQYSDHIIDVLCIPW